MKIIEPLAILCHFCSSTDDFRRNAIQNHFLMPTRKNEANNNQSPNYGNTYMPMDLKVESAAAENMEDILNNKD